jgi:hypothetical protein
MASLKAHLTPSTAAAPAANADRAASARRLSTSNADVTAVAAGAIAGVKHHVTGAASGSAGAQVCASAGRARFAGGDADFTGVYTVARHERDPCAGHTRLFPTQCNATARSADAARQRCHRRGTVVLDTQGSGTHNGHLATAIVSRAAFNGEITACTRRRARHERDNSTSNGTIFRLDKHRTTVHLRAGPASEF